MSQCLLVLESGPDVAELLVDPDALLLLVLAIAHVADEDGESPHPGERHLAPDPNPIHPLSPADRISDRITSDPTRRSGRGKQDHGSASWKQTLGQREEKGGERKVLTGDLGMQSGSVNQTFLFDALSLSLSLFLMIFYFLFLVLVDF